MFKSLCSSKKTQRSLWQFRQKRYNLSLGDKEMESPASRPGYSVTHITHCIGGCVSRSRSAYMACKKMSLRILQPAARILQLATNRLLNNLRQFIPLFTYNKT